MKSSRTTSSSPSRIPARLVAKLFTALSVTALASGSIANAQLASGNLIVERVGTGSGALGSTSVAVFLDQYTPTGTAGTTITIPSSGATQLTNSGSATSEGLVTVSPNGLILNIAGYNAAAGTASVVATTSAATARVVNFISADGTVTRGATSNTAFSANNIRSAVSNGTDIWASGANTGTLYLGSGTPATVSTTITNQRQIGIFAGATGGQLYFSSGSGTQGIYSVGSGTPTSGTNTATVMIATNTLGGGSSPYAFSMNTSKTVAYVADSTAGISKYTSSNAGATWVRNGTYANTLTGSLGTTGLTVDWSNPNAPTVYASSPTNLYKLTDTGGSGAASYGTATNLATAATNTAFRGVQLGVLPSVWTKVAADGSTTDWNTSTAATQSSNWSTIQASGSNIAFQNVNAGPSALNLTVSNSNNSPITNLSSIEFKSGGFGGGAGNTFYTLSGTTGVTLSGAGSSSAVGTFTANATTYTSVLANNSGVTQTVSIPLTLGAANQAIRAVSGDLAINGTLANGGNTLTVGGAGNTTFGSSAVISGSGGLTKVEAGTLTLSANNTYSGGTTISAGTLLVTNTIGSGTGSGNVTVNAGSLGGTGTISGSVALNGATIGSSGSTLTLNSNLTTTGTSNVAATSTVNVAGTTTVSSGTLTVNGALGVNGSIAGTGAVVVSSTGSLTGNATINNATTVSGGTFGTSGNTLNLGSTLAASGNNTIATGVTVNVTGNTTISSGVFTVNGTLGGTGAKIVGSGATLKGNSTISGPTTVQLGGILSPGNSPGIQNFSDDVTLAGTTIMEINGTGRGTAYDGINLTTGAGQDLFYGGTLSLSFGAAITAGTYDLFALTDGVAQSGTFGVVSIAGTAVASNTAPDITGTGWTASLIDTQSTPATWSLSFNNASGDLTITAIPEPSAYAALAGVGMIGFALYRRRRQNAAKRAA